MLRSLRGRVLVASVLWTVGLILIVSMVFSLAMEHVPRARLVANVHGFLQAYIVVAGATLCLIGAVVQGRRTLASIDNLRTRLVSLRAGRERRMDGVYPSEVQPLVDDLNVLLDHRERAIQRAIAKAGDLAHGLKTPLAILSQESALARTTGQTEIADAIDRQVERMGRQIEYHLAQARAAASGATGGARSSLKESADGLVRAMARLHAERGLVIDSTISSDLEVRVQREDLDEMLGNLLDNACKWGRSRVAVHAAADGHTAVVVTVDDDGHGLKAEMREAVLRRGFRADEAAPGSGLGLAIVSDLAELYGGSISLDASPAGGLQARLRLPSAPPRGE
jgi:signal transduction histidine kinase